MRKYLAAAALTLCALTACDDNGTEPQQQGRVRVVQAISNVATADVLFGTTVMNTDLAYKGIYTNNATPAGAITIKVRKADATTDLASVPVTVEANKSYTVIALGTEAAPQQIALADDIAAPAEGKAKVRVVHAAAAEGAVDVYVVKTAADLATATAAKANLAMKTASDYIVVDANPTYLVILTEPGTKTPVLTVQGVVLTAGEVRTVVAVEKAGDPTTLESVVIEDR